MLPSSLTVQQKARVFAPRKVHSSLILTRDGAIAWGLYYRALRIRNLRENDRFCCVFSASSHKHTSLGKHTGLSLNLYFTNTKSFIVQAPGLTFRILDWPEITF